MSKLSIYENSWINLVFEGKNKDYGAYQLRRESDRTTAIAFLFGLVLVSAVACIPLVLNLIGGEKLSISLPEAPDTVIHVSNIYIKPEQPKKTVAPITRRKADPVQRQDQLKNPVIVKTPEATPDVTPNNESTNTNNSTQGSGTETTPTTTGGGGINSIPPVIIPDETPKPPTALDKLPEFPGGIEKFYGYVGKHFNNPDMDEPKTLRVYVSFVIEKDGSMTDIRVKRDPGFGLGNEAIRVLKSLKTKWEPGMIAGKPVRTSYNLPITVQVQ